jgi:PQQ-like domain
MLRIRIGQHWKHEGATEAVDGFGLELDGVALVPGASEEPLGLVMEQLLLATAALGAGQALAQVSLPESSQELLLVRHEDGLLLHVLRLGRPAGAVRPPVRLDTEAWRRAVVRAGQGWISDLRTSAAPARLRQKARALLSRADREPRAFTSPAPGWGLRLEPRTVPGFRLEASDEDGLLERVQRRAPVPVAALALPGRLQLVSHGEPSWEVRGPTGLLALELLRQAEEVVRALEAEDKTLRLLPAGAPLPWQLDLLHGSVVAPGLSLRWPAVDVAQAMVAPALALATLLRALDARFGESRYLLDFTTRGRAVLAALRALVVRPTDEPRPRERRRPAHPPAAPLHRGAQVRRLGFLRRGQLKALAGEGEAELRALSPGFVLVGRTRAAVVTADGTVARRWTAPKGLALGATGEALLAENARWLSVHLQAADARWFRDSDGAALDGPLLVTPEQLVLATQPSGVRAVDRFTGRELWRFLPQRPQRLRLGLHSGRVLVASESGAVHGLDLQGSVRFRLTAPLPCLGPPVLWGRSATVALGRGDRMAVLVLDPHQGAIRWLREFPLAFVSGPVARGARLRLLGQRDGTPVLLSLGPRGATQWERPLPLGPAPWTLHSDADASLATAADGSGVRVDAQGRLEWRLGGQKAHAVASAVLQRRVLLVPGDTIRAVDVRSGRVVAEIASPGGLHALAATETLDVAALDAAGDLTVWNLGASLGVVQQEAP